MTRLAMALLILLGMLAAALCGAGFRHVLGSPVAAVTLPNDAFAWHSLDRAYTVLDGQDTPDRLEYFRTLARGEDTAVLDRVLAQLFPQRTANPGEREILHVLSYVAQVTRLQSSNRHLGSQVLTDGHAFCYGMARAFVALCRRLGFPARINALHNFEWMQAHNMAEVYYEGAWRLFDPTYGAFFYTEAAYPGQGVIPSARALLTGRVSDVHLFQTCEALWTGVYQADWVVRPFPEDFRYGKYPFTVKELYDRILSNAFPFVQSELEMTSFPVVLDIGEERELQIGALDGDLQDGFGRRPNGTFPRFFGMPFLGHMRLGPKFHTITVKASSPGRFRLTYHFLPSGRHDTLSTVELRDVLFDAFDRDERTWSATFKLQGNEGQFLVINRQQAAYIDAMTLSRLE